MSIPVRVPSASEDQPRWVVLVGLAIVCAAAGLGLARWGTYSRHDGAHEDRAHAELTPDQSEAVTREREPAVEAAPEPAAQPRAASEIEPEPTAVADPEPAAIVEPEPDTQMPAALPIPPAREEPPRAPARAMRIVPGRVAYLRCDGVPQRRGPVPCPRDESLEGAAWTAIDGLASCAALPPREGEADLVLDFAAADATPEIRARDTFARDVVRLDAAPVVQCLTPALSALRQTMGSSRLVVSFRFAAR